MVHRNLQRLYANIPAARIRAWQQREVSIAHLEAVGWRVLAAVPRPLLLLRRLAVVSVLVARGGEVRAGVVCLYFA